MLLRPGSRAGIAALVLVMAFACGRTERDGDGEPSNNGATAGSAGASHAGQGNTGGLDSGSGGSSAAGADGGSPGEFCWGYAYEYESLTLDYIVAVDNADSMMDVTEAVEDAINVELSTARQNGSQVILVTRHRRDDPSADAAEATSICAREPLSGLAACPAPEPAFADRFYHWDGRLDRNDLLDTLLSGYSSPPEGQGAALAPNGYGEWLREFAGQVFIVITDGDESLDPVETPLSADEFIAGMTSLWDRFGDPDKPYFDVHSIVGLAAKPDATSAYSAGEPIVEAVCSGNGVVPASAGPTYQELSIKTDGLRFPLCELDGLGAAFEEIAKAYLPKLPCAVEANPDLDLSPPLVFDPRIDVFTYDGIVLDFVESADQCTDSSTSSFYIDGSLLVVCPATCDAANEDGAWGLSVAFACER